MHTHRLALSAALISCILITGALLPLTHAASPAPILTQLDRIRDAEPHLRSKERRQLVNLCTGTKTIVPLLEAINEDDRDGNFVLHCVQAIGETAEKCRARGPLPPADQAAATKVLLKYLTGRDTRLAFAACETLGKLWKDKGALPALGPVNAELLACMHKHWAPLLEHSASTALVVINNIRGADGRRLDPVRKTPAELHEIVITWSASHQSRLSPALARPWLLKLHALTAAASTPARDTAARILIDAAQLYPVDPMLDLLAEEDAVSADVRRKIGIVLEALTGLPFPPPKVAAEQHVAEWRRAWYASLRNKPSASVNSAVWTILEFSMRRYARVPSEEMAQRIQAVRLVLAHVLPDPESIPADASAAARAILLPPLESKGLIVEMLAKYDKASDALARQATYRKLRQEVGKTSRTVVSIQFGQAFLDRAFAAELRSDRPSSELFELLLGIVTQVPCEVKGDTPEERLASLMDWLDLVTGLDPPLTMPARPAPVVAPPEPEGGGE